IDDGEYQCAESRLRRQTGYRPYRCVEIHSSIKLFQQGCEMNSTLVDAKFRIAELEDRSRRQTIAMACTLVSLIDLRDQYTGSHSSRVAEYCRRTALRMGLSDTEVESIVLAASLHDIGKIGVPDHVLLKPGKLDENEFEWIK